MKSWSFQSKDGRPIAVRCAGMADARELHDGFCAVVSEGQWLPTFVSTASVSDWANWIQRASVGCEAILVAELDGQYAGHLTLQPEEWMASRHVAKLGIIVTKSLRNLGVGRALMIGAEEEALVKEYEKIVLSTFRDNELALSLYQSLGYRTIGFREHHFKMERGYVDEVLMEKTIQGVQGRE